MNASDPDHPTSTPGTAAPESPNAARIVRHAASVSPAEREALLGQRAQTLWFTGLSAAGKSTLAYALERRLVDQRRLCCVLDGDNVRHGLNRNLGFSPEDRAENIRRIAEVARLMNDAGLIVIAAFISPFRADRAMARDIVGAGRISEVHVSTPLAVCERRDPKGLYGEARAGRIADFTGIGSPYEPPEAPALTIDTARESLADALARLQTLIDRPEDDDSRRRS